MCEWERVWRLKAKWRARSFRGYLVRSLPTKWSICPAHDWNAKSQDRLVTAGFRKCLAGKAFPQDTRKTFCFVNLSYLIHTIYTHIIYTHITHKCLGVLLRENPNHNPWELEIVIPTFLYTIHCGFSSTPTSPFSYPWEVDNPNTYHNHSECLVRFWCCWEELKEAKLWQMQSSVLRDLESQKRHGSEKPCWSRNLEGLGALGRLGLEGLLLLMYPNWLSSGSIYCLEGGGEVLRRVLRFSLR